MDATELRRLEETEGCEDETQEESEPTGWATEDQYRLLSVRLLVRTMHPRFAGALRWHLAPFSRPGPDAVQGEVADMWEREDPDGSLADGDDGPRFVYFRDGTTRIASLPSLLSYAIWDLHAMVPQVAQDFLFLHAGAVARDGAAILLVGPMDAGKSTLTTALLMEGFGYLSDELGAIDPVTTRAYPFEKRIALDPEALVHLPGLDERIDRSESLAGGLRQLHLGPEVVDATVAPASPVGSLIFLGGDRSGPPNLTRVSRADALQRLVPQCFSLDRFGERGVVLLSRLVRDSTSYVLEGGAPRPRARLLSETLT